MSEPLTRSFSITSQDTIVEDWDEDENTNVEDNKNNEANPIQSIPSIDLNNFHSEYYLIDDENYFDLASPFFSQNGENFHLLRFTSLNLKKKRK